jgi:hypothetical protein
MFENFDIANFLTLVNLGFQKFDEYWLIIIEIFGDFKLKLFNIEITKVLW